MLKSRNGRCLGRRTRVELVTLNSFSLDSFPCFCNLQTFCMSLEKCFFPLDTHWDYPGLRFLAVTQPGIAICMFLSFHFSLQCYLLNMNAVPLRLCSDPLCSRAFYFVTFHFFTLFFLFSILCLKKRIVNILEYIPQMSLHNY